MSDKRAAVFLDRDGVLNHLVTRDGRLVSPRNTGEFRLVEQLEGHLGRLARLGYFLVVVTNQPDIARGLLAEDDLQKMHDQLRHLVDAVIVCRHDNDDDCVCRKPRSGMITSAAVDFRLDLPRSWVIGDRWVDLVAGLGAGCGTALVEHGESWVGMPTDCVARDHLDARAEDLGSIIDAIENRISQGTIK